MVDEQSVPGNAGNPGNDSTRAMNYMVEVFLDKNWHISRTRIHHIQSGEEITWDNWDEAGLLTFFYQRPELRLTKPAAAAKTAGPDQLKGINAAGSKSKFAATVDPLPATSACMEAYAGVLKSGIASPVVRTMEIIPERSSIPRRSFGHNQAFIVRLDIDLTEMKFSRNGSLDYSVAMLARRLGAERSQEFVKDRGTINYSNHSLTLNLKWSPLPPGTYRISAAVTLISRDADAALQGEFSTSSPGSLYKIF
jgi:hypothetical protein